MRKRILSIMLALPISLGLASYPSINALAEIKYDMPVDDFDKLEEADQETIDEVNDLFYEFNDELENFHYTFELDYLNDKGYKNPVEKSSVVYDGNMHFKDDEFEAQSNVTYKVGSKKTEYILHTKNDIGVREDKGKFKKTTSALFNEYWFAGNVLVDNMADFVVYDNEDSLLFVLEDEGDAATDYFLEKVFVAEPDEGTTTKVKSVFSLDKKTGAIKEFMALMIIDDKETMEYRFTFDKFNKADALDFPADTEKFFSDTKKDDTDKDKKSTDTKEEDKDSEDENKDEDTDTEKTKAE